MANKNRTGFYPVGTLTGASWTGSVRRFIANTTLGAGNICVGDLVQLDALGKAQTLVGAGANIIGAVVGIEPVAKTTTSVQGASLNLERAGSYLIAGSETGTKYVRVVTDPMCVYETVTSNGTTIAVTNIGENYNVLGLGAGGQTAPQTTPLSPLTLDLGNPQVSVAGQLILMDIPGYPDNELTSANTRVQVILNSSLTHTAKPTAG